MLPAGSGPLITTENILSRQTKASAGACCALARGVQGDSGSRDQGDPRKAVRERWQSRTRTQWPWLGGSAASTTSASIPPSWRPSGPAAGSAAGCRLRVVHLLDHGAAPYLRVLRGAADVVDLGDGDACRGEQAGLVRAGVFGEGRGWRSGRCGCERGRGWWRSGDPSRGGQGPAASAKARPRPSLPAAAMMWPSAAAKASQGTIVGRAEPYRSGVRPVAYQPGARQGSQARLPVGQADVHLAAPGRASLSSRMCRSKAWPANTPA